MSRNAAESRFSLARAWHSKGVIRAAIMGYREALKLDPGHDGAAILLGALLQSQERLQEAVEVYREALKHHPNDAHLHKQLVATLLVHDGAGAVFDYYRLMRRDSKPIELKTSDIICCVVVHNVSGRLPYFLDYYRRKGIGAFFAVDSGSSDESLQYLLDQPDVYVWQSDLSFDRANGGAGWLEPILRLYGRDRWCLIVADDELLHYADCETVSIRDLCRGLDLQRKRAFPAVSLDTNGGKVPLIKYDEDCILSGGQQSTNLPADQISESRGAVLKLEDSNQLIRLGVMTPGPAPVPPVFPAIKPVSDSSRPLWSVILTVYRRTEYIGQALRSVLSQDPGPEQMQIEIICEGPASTLQLEIQAKIREIAGDRVVVYRHPDRAGQPGIFNVALARARGLWVHILHDDDWVAPNFYEAMHSAILAEPGIGAAFCRHTYVDENGRPLRFSFLERETAGILDGWLDRIACSCRLQTPAIVVRREVYEKLGGYCPLARSAYDWEMWQRLAVHYPVWYDPAPMAFFRVHQESESVRLTDSGQQIADSSAVIEIAHDYLPESARATLSRRAGDMYALHALERASAKMADGNTSAAMALLGEAVRSSTSAEVTEKLFAWLRNVSASFNGSPKK